MIGSSAPNRYYFSYTFCNIFQIFKIHIAILFRYPATNCIKHSMWLLVDFLQHKMLVAAFFDSNWVPVDWKYFPLNFMSIKVSYSKSIPLKYSNVAVL